MPSRFSTGAPSTPRALYLTERLLGIDPNEAWDYYDDCPLDPDWIPSGSLINCSPNRRPAV